MCDTITLTGVIGDIGIFAIMCGTGAAVINWAMGMVKNPS
jgi:hypothetical protein